MQADLVLIDSVEEVDNFLRWLSERRPLLFFDTETTGLDPMRDHIRLAQFGDGATGWAMDYRDWRGLVRHVLDRYEGPIGAFNMKFDASMVEADGLTFPRHRCHDPMIMCHLADSHGPKALKPASVRYVDRGAMAGERELKTAMHKAGWDWATVPTDFEPYWLYGALDTVLGARLAETLWKRIQYSREAYEIETAVAWVLLGLEQRGTRVDLGYVDTVIERLSTELVEIEARWPDLNLHSTDQVIDRLRAEGVRFTKRTKKGNTALDDDVLADIDLPLARDAREARDRKKLLSTYFLPYQRLTVDDLLHPNINQLGAEKTGRMSISRPSMQNIPRTKLVRSAIIPREGHRLLLADWQAQETRLFAHFSGDENLTRIFREGLDVHTIVASQVYGIPESEVDYERRRKAKQGGHARNYGSGATKVALTVDVAIAEAAAFIRRYDAEFPGIPRLHRRLNQVVREREIDGWGYVVSLNGRRIKVPLEKIYIAANYLMQGSGADMMKRALVNADRLGIAEYLDLPVHDELVYDVPEDLLGDVEPLIHEAMELSDLRVPMPIETKIVSCWGEAYD